MRRLILGGSVAAALAFPAGADAASVRLVDDFDQRSNTTTQEVVYDAAAGEANNLHAAFNGTRFFWLDDAVAISPGRGCIRPNPAEPTIVRCEITADGGTSGITVNAGDRDDEVEIGGANALIRGGDGNDDLIGPDFGSRFEGGRGDDHLTGGDSTDLFDEGSSANGADHISGGRGVDEVSYAGRRHKVHADLQEDADDGEIGEHDAINDDVEDLTGGRGNDRLTGNIAQNTLIGGGGSDLLKGDGSDDTLAAGQDSGETSRSHTHDRLYGGDGIDTLLGSAGPNRMSGGPRPDFIYAAGGNDRIRERDGQIDTIECGHGRDRAQLDGFDFFADRCERVSRPFIPAAVPLELSSTGRNGGTAFVEVGCPRDAPRTCHGRVVLEWRGRTLGSRKFRVRHARRKSVGVTLPGWSTGQLRSGGHRVRVIVRSKDARGRTRIIRTPLELPAY